MIADELLSMLKRCTRVFADNRPSLMRRTFFTFVIHRERGYGWPEMSDQEYEDEQKQLEDLFWEFQALLDPNADGTMDFWIDQCDIIWEDTHRGWPACGLGVMDGEKLEEYEVVDGDSVSDLSSSWSSW